MVLRTGAGDSSSCVGSRPVCVYIYMRPGRLLRAGSVPEMERLLLHGVTAGRRRPSAAVRIVWSRQAATRGAPRAPSPRQAGVWRG